MAACVCRAPVRTLQAHRGGGHAHRSASHLQAGQGVNLLRLVELICHQGFQIGVGDGLLFIRQALKPLKGFFKIGVAEGVAQLSQARPEGVPAGVFSQHQTAAVGADIFGTHDLVGQVILQHAILVDAGFVGKSIRANDGFIRLDDNAGVVADQLACPADLGGVDACGKVIRRGGGCAAP